jgi:hypothetical protein
MYVLAPERVKSLLLAVALVLASGEIFAYAQAVTPSDGQLSRQDSFTIVNPRQTDVPRERARVLMLTTCRVVAEQYHRKPEDIALRLTLVLGDPNERVGVDDSGMMTLYLERWNETRFVNGVITGAIQSLTTVGVRKEMYAEILRRTDRVAPIAANQLRMSNRNEPLPRQGIVRDCISAVNASPCFWPRTPPLP